VENLLLQKDDFDVCPIFSRPGGSYRKLNEVFGGKLDQIISELNRAVLS